MVEGVVLVVVVMVAVVKMGIGVVVRVLVGFVVGVVLVVVVLEVVVVIMVGIMAGILVRVVHADVVMVKFIGWLSGGRGSRGQGVGLGKAWTDMEKVASMQALLADIFRENCGYIYISIYTYKALCVLVFLWVTPVCSSG